MHDLDSFVCDFHYTAEKSEVFIEGFSRFATGDSVQALYHLLA